MTNKVDNEFVFNASVWPMSRPFMSEGLTQCEMDSVYHHFNARLETRSINQSREWVDTAVRKLTTVKSNAIVKLMNSSEPHHVVLDTREQVLDVGSIMSAHVIASQGANSAEGRSRVPVCMKMATPLPGTVRRAPEIFAELISTLLGRSSMWGDSEALRSKLYSCVYGGTPIPTAAEWSVSADGSSVSVTTLVGLQLKCSLLGQGVPGPGVSKTAIGCDDRFTHRMMCQNVTATYTQQPMVFTVSCGGDSEILSACVYPCSASTNGLFLGTVHASGFEQPLKSCAVVTNKTLRVHPHWGVHEADAMTLTTPYARGHMHTLSNIYIKSCIMRAVLVDHSKQFEVSRLGDMDEIEMLTQYKSLRDTLSIPQSNTCSEIWNGMCAKNGPGCGIRVRCLSGAFDCFKKDGFHTDMALHTRNVIQTSFKYGGVDHHVSSPLVLSMYGTYYHR
jgi:hypothetical protein